MNLFNKNFLDWNLDDLNDFISNNLFENIYFDLKESMIEVNKLSKVVCSFANTEGGFIFFGIKDKTYELVGVNRDIEFQKHFGDKIKKIVPQINFDIKELLLENKKAIYIVYIKKSLISPHISEDSINNNSNHGLFYKRSASGESICMNYMDIKNSFYGYQEKIAKLNQFYMELILNKNVAENKINCKNKSDISLKQYNTKVIDIILPDLYLLIEDDFSILQEIINLRERIMVSESLEKRLFFYSTMPLSNANSNIVNINNQLATISERINQLINIITSKLILKYNLKEITL